MKQAVINYSPFHNSSPFYGGFRFTVKREGIMKRNVINYTRTEARQMNEWNGFLYLSILYQIVLIIDVSVSISLPIYQSIHLQLCLSVCLFFLIKLIFDKYVTK